MQEFAGSLQYEARGNHPNTDGYDWSTAAAIHYRQHNGGTVNVTPPSYQTTSSNGNMMVWTPQTTPHQINIENSAESIRTTTKSFVKEVLFRHVKFITAEDQLAWNYPRFAKPILDKLNVFGDEKRQMMWKECRKYANLALRERRSSVNSAIKSGVIGEYMVKVLVLQQFCIDTNDLKLCSFVQKGNDAVF